MKDCRQRRARRAGALATVMRLLVVVFVLVCETSADAQRPHLPRDADTARPLPFSVNTYDEAVVSRTFLQQIFLRY